MGWFDALLGASQGASKLADEYAVDQEKEKARQEDLAKTQLGLASQMGDRQGFGAAAQKLGFNMPGANTYFDRQDQAYTTQQAEGALKREGMAQDIAASKHTMGVQDQQLGLDRTKTLLGNEQWKAEFAQRVKQDGIKNAIEWAHANEEHWYHAGTLDNEGRRITASATRTGDNMLDAYGKVAPIMEKMFPRKKDASGESDETDQQYMTRITPYFNRLLNHAGYPSLPGEAPLPPETPEAIQYRNTPLPGHEPKAGGAPTPGGNFAPALGRTPPPGQAPGGAPTHQGYVPRPRATPAIPTPSGTGRWSREVDEISKRNNVDPALVVAIMQQESGGNPGATSPVGAQGLMQLMPGTASGLGVHDAYNPRQNLEGSVKHIAQLLKRFNGDLRLTAAAYNAGSDDTEAAKGKKIGPFAKSHDDPRFLVWENPQNGGYAETRDYVQKVLANYAALTGEPLPQQPTPQRSAAPGSRAATGGGATAAAQALRNKYRPAGPTPLPSDRPAN